MCQEVKIQYETRKQDLNSVDIVGVVRAGPIRVNVVELDVIVTLSAELDSLVDLDRLGELAIRLQVSRLVGGVLQDHVGLRVLQI